MSMSESFGRPTRICSIFFFGSITLWAILNNFSAGVSSYFSWTCMAYLCALYYVLARAGLVRRLGLAFVKFASTINWWSLARLFEELSSGWARVVASPNPLVDRVELTQPCRFFLSYKADHRLMQTNSSNKSSGTKQLLTHSGAQIA